MTEEEWLSCKEPERMLAKRGIFSERQLILFGCACCHLVWELFADGCSQQAVTAAERFADGECTESTLRAARDLVERTYPNLHWTEVYPELFIPHAAWFAAFDTIATQEFEAQHPLSGDSFDDMLTAVKVELSDFVIRAEADTWNAEPHETRANHAAVVRDIFGNPFQPVAFASEWRTGTAVPLARQMYESRDFSAMPILADALQDAGCDNNDVLTHCRSAGPHVRGCWVADLVLGKE